MQLTPLLCALQLLPPILQQPYHLEEQKLEGLLQQFDKKKTERLDMQIKFRNKLREVSESKP
jgi:hypothetical protein